MNIKDMKVGEVLEIAKMLGGKGDEATLNRMIGQRVIVRTYSAGVWFGTLDEKSGNEVILTDARRMWRWWAAKGISLSGCANHGVLHEKSKIVEPVESVWLEAIEIIPCTMAACLNIEAALNAKAE